MNTRIDGTAGRRRRSRRAMTRGLAWMVAGMAALTGVAVSAQKGTTGGEWRTYGGDLGNTRYSPLDQINAANFSKLEVAWRFKTDNLGPRPEFNLESTPLMVNGVALLHRRHAARGRRARCRDRRTALDAQRATKARAAQPRRGSSRAAGSPTGPTASEERILYVTPGYRLVALDAKTGRPVAGFGKNGIVDLKQDYDQKHRSRRPAPVGLHATPIVAEERRHRRRGVRDRREPEEPEQREGLRPRLRRADRQAAVDLPHHPAARRVRQRDVGERLLVVHRQHRRVGADLRRRGARAGLSAGRNADARLLRRRAARATTCSARASSPSI